MGRVLSYVGPPISSVAQHLLNLIHLDAFVLTSVHASCCHPDFCASLDADASLAGGGFRKSDDGDFRRRVAVDETRFDVFFLTWRNHHRGVLSGIWLP